MFDGYVGWKFIKICVLKEDILYFTQNLAFVYGGWPFNCVCTNQYKNTTKFVV